jgi:hypothetical protein
MKARLLDRDLTVTWTNIGEQRETYTSGIWLERVIFAQRQGPTWRDRERQNRAFIRDSGLTRGQGGTPDCGQIAVKT